MEVQQAPARFVRKADRLTVRQERMLRFLYACPFYYSMMTVHFQIKSPLKEYKTPESSDCAWPKSSACPRISRDDLLELQYRLARRRNTSDIVTLLISLAFLIWNLVKFFQMA